MWLKGFVLAFSGTIINVHTSKHEFYHHDGCSFMLSYMTQKTECVLKVMKLWFDLGEAISSSSFKKESAERSPLESTAWNCLSKVSSVCVWFML